MRKFTNIFLFLGGLLIIPFVVAIFTKKEYGVERSTTILMPIDTVFGYIKLLKNQDNYSVWANMDSNMVKTFIGTDGEVGFVSGWSSSNKNVGKGEQKIIAIKENERIDYELKFIEPFSSVSYAFMTTKPISENSTLVTWGFMGKMSYPTNIFLLFSDLGDLIGKDYDTGLENLKNVLEQKEEAVVE